MLVDIAKRKIANVNHQMEIWKEFGGPRILMVAELFLILAAGLYLVKAIMVSNELVSGSQFSEFSLLMFLVNLAFVFLSINATFGLSSKKIKSWCAVVRCSGLMFVASMIAYFFQIRIGLAGDITFDPLLAGIISIPVILIMFLPSTRAFYTPPMMKKKSIALWILNVFGIKMYKANEYRLRYH